MDHPIGRADVVLEDDGSALVSWIEDGTAGMADILLRSVQPDGSLGTPVPVSRTQSSRAAGFPRMARLGNEVFLTWTQAARTWLVQTAVYR